MNDRRAGAKGINLRRQISGEDIERIAGGELGAGTVHIVPVARTVRYGTEWGVFNFFRSGRMT